LPEDLESQTSPNLCMNDGVVHTCDMCVYLASVPLAAICP